MELRGRRRKLAEAKASLDRALEAGATFAMADLQLRSAKYAKAAKLAMAAESQFTKPNDKAKALRLYVKAVVREPERELFEDMPSFPSQAQGPLAQAHGALKQVEKCMEAWQRAGNLKAAALMGLALADVHTLLARPREALQAAEKALERFECLKDLDGSARALHTTARIRMLLGTDVHTRRALAELEKALELLQRRGDTKRESSTLLMLSRAHLQRQEYQDAYAFAGGAAKLAQANGHIQEEALAMKELAHVLLLSRGDPDRAAQFALDAAEVFRHLDDWLSEISARHVLSRAYQADGFVNMAHEALATALRLARQLKDVRQIGAALEGISRILTKAQAPEAALECLQEEARMASDAKGSLQRELAALERVALMQSRLGSHDDAEKTAEKAVLLARGDGRKRDLARALKLAAEVSFSAKRHDEGMDAALSAKSLFAELGDTHSLVALWRSVLAMHKDQGDDKQILRAWEEMTQAHEAAGQKLEAAELHMERAKWMSERKTLRDVLQPAQRAARLFETANDKEGFARALLWFCELPDFSQRYPDEAFLNADTVKRICLQAGDIDGEVRARRILSKVHLKRNCASKAVEVSQEALEIARTAGGKRSQALALQGLADVHAQLIFRDVENGLMPSESIVQDAIVASADASTLFTMHGDDAGVAVCMVQVSRLHLVVGDIELALQASINAVEAAQRTEDARVQGGALLATARAYKESGHAREMKQAAERAREHFERANSHQGVAEVKRLLKGSRHLKSGDTFQAEFEQLWNKLYSPPNAPPPPQLRDLEDDSAPHHALASFPESLGGELKWYVWNGIWYAANSRFAEYLEGDERKERLQSADEDFKRMDKHFLTAKLEKTLPVSSLRGIGKQAEAAGMSACDAFVAGKSLAATSVQALPAPAGINENLWPRVVQAVRLAAAAVTEKLMEGSSSESSSSEDDRQQLKGRGKGLNSGQSKALARPISVFARGIDGQGSSLVDVQELEISAEQRRARILARPPPPGEAPDEPEKQPAPETAAAAPGVQAFGTPLEEVEKEEEEEGAARAGVLTLAEVLQAVRQDWSSKEIQAVLDKLAKIHIGTAEQLFCLLRAKGVKGVNSQLKAAGQKCLKSETLAALHEYGESSGGAVDSLG